MISCNWIWKQVGDYYRGDKEETFSRSRRLDRDFALALCTVAAIK
jgi:hypothetical protein